MDFMQQEIKILVDAFRVNTTHIRCITPSISESFNEYIDNQREAYITVNDLDGEFRPENSLLFTYLRDYGLTETFPTYTYMR